MGAACLPWWLPFAPILSRLHHRLDLPRSISVPLAWTSTEWIRSTFTVSHFDLYGLGYSQARFPALVQIADVTGVYGISFLLAAAGGWLADLGFASRRDGFRAALRLRRIRVGGTAIVAAIVVFSGYGAWRLASIRHEPGPRLALVQPNVPHTQQNMVGVHLEQLLMTQRNVPAGEVDLIVWPENAILDNIRRPGAYLEDLAWMAREKDAWFLVGALGKPAEHPGRTTNGAWLIDRDGEIRGHYDKQVLFPWGEYIPGDAFLGRWAPAVQRFHRELTRMGWGFQPTGLPGDATDVLEFPWNGEMLRFAALICVENTFPPLPAEAGALGADFFLNITSEGKVGGPVQEQLLRIAMFRAIENRMSYVRVGNTGISGVIDSHGVARAILVGDNGNTINTAGVLTVDVPLSRSGTTLYSRSGDAFVKIVLVLTAALLLGSLFRRGRRSAAATVTATVLLVAGCSSPPPLGSDPSAVDDALRRGRALLEAGRRGEAIEALTGACATEEGCALALPRLYEAYDPGKEDDDAVVLFGLGLERYPALGADALAFRAAFRDRSLDVAGARDDYVRSLEVRPSARVHGRLGNLYMRMERFEDALEQFRAGLDLTPEDPQLRAHPGPAGRVGACPARSGRGRAKPRERLDQPGKDPARPWAPRGCGAVVPCGGSGRAGYHRGPFPAGAARASGRGSRYDGNADP
jgi:apolipoprotein N-acyltransferase